MAGKLFTSESVTEGHPDKICDQISDAILDELLAGDRYSRVACETIVTTGMALVMGEITTKTAIDIPALVRSVISDIGYTDSAYGFDADTCSVLTTIDRQSPDIAMGVDLALESRNGGEREMGAGDQGMMFGYACDETKEFMPLPISLAHSLAKRLTAVRKDGTLPFLRPDGKTQVTVEYEDNRPVRVDTVVLSTQHSEDVSMDTLHEAVLEEIIKKTVPAQLIDANTKFYINPTGRFVVGGPAGDSGLTGRKIIVDTYGGVGRHGGGCFSGKDPSKVDRSAAYAARYVAKNVVAAGLAQKCEVQIAYAIGKASPVSVRVDTFGTGAVPENVIEKMITSNLDFSPSSIIDCFDLRRPIYRGTATFGHMGREDLGVPWEKLGLVSAFRK